MVAGLVNYADVVRNSNGTYKGILEFQQAKAMQIALEKLSGENILGTAVRIIAENELKENMQSNASEVRIPADRRHSRSQSNRSQTPQHLGRKLTEPEFYKESSFSPQDRSASPVRKKIWFEELCPRTSINKKLMRNRHKPESRVHNYHKNDMSSFRTDSFRHLDTKSKYYMKNNVSRNFIDKKPFNAHEPANKSYEQFSSNTKYTNNKNFRTTHQKSQENVHYSKELSYTQNNSSSAKFPKPFKNLTDTTSNAENSPNSFRKTSENKKSMNKILNISQFSETLSENNENDKLTFLKRQDAEKLISDTDETYSKPFESEKNSIDESCKISLPERVNKSEFRSLSDDLPQNQYLNSSQSCLEKLSSVSEINIINPDCSLSSNKLTQNIEKEVTIELVGEKSESNRTLESNNLDNMSVKTMNLNDIPEKNIDNTSVTSNQEDSAEPPPSYSNTRRSLKDVKSHTIQQTKEQDVNQIKVSQNSESTRWHKSQKENFYKETVHKDFSEKKFNDRTQDQMPKKSETQSHKTQQSNDNSQLSSMKSDFVSESHVKQNPRNITQDKTDHLLLSQNKSEESALDSETKETETVSDHVELRSTKFSESDEFKSHELLITEPPKAILRTESKHSLTEKSFANNLKSTTNEELDQKYIESDSSDNGTTIVAKSSTYKSNESEFEAIIKRDVEKSDITQIDDDYMCKQNQENLMDKTVNETNFNKESKQNNKGEMERIARNNDNLSTHSSNEKGSGVEQNFDDKSYLNDKNKFDTARSINQLDHRNEYNPRFSSSNKRNFGETDQKRYETNSFHDTKKRQFYQPYSKEALSTKSYYIPKNHIRNKWNVEKSHRFLKRDSFLEKNINYSPSNKNQFEFSAKKLYIQPPNKPEYGTSPRDFDYKGYHRSGSSVDYQKKETYKHSKKYLDNSPSYYMGSDRSRSGKPEKTHDRYSSDFIPKEKAFQEQKHFSNKYHEFPQSSKQNLYESINREIKNSKSETYKRSEEFQSKFSGKKPQKINLNDSEETFIANVHGKKLSEELDYNRNAYCGPSQDRNSFRNKYSFRQSRDHSFNKYSPCDKVHHNQLLYKQNSHHFPNKYHDDQSSVKQSSDQYYDKHYDDEPSFEYSNQISDRTPVEPYFDKHSHECSRSELYKNQIRGKYFEKNYRNQHTEKEPCDKMYGKQFFGQSSKGNQFIEGRNYLPEKKVNDRNFENQYHEKRFYRQIPGKRMNDQISYRDPPFEKNYTDLTFKNQHGDGYFEKSNRDILYDKTSYSLTDKKRSSSQVFGQHPLDKIREKHHFDRFSRKHSYYEKTSRDGYCENSYYDGFNENDFPNDVPKKKFRDEYVRSNFCNGNPEKSFPDDFSLKSFRENPRNYREQHFKRTFYEESSKKSFDDENFRNNDSEKDFCDRFPKDKFSDEYKNQKTTQPRNFDESFKNRSRDESLKKLVRNETFAKHSDLSTENHFHENYSEKQHIKVSTDKGSRYNSFENSRKGFSERQLSDEVSEKQPCDEFSEKKLRSDFPEQQPHDEFTEKQPHNESSEQRKCDESPKHHVVDKLSEQHDNILKQRSRDKLSEHHSGDEIQRRNSRSETSEPQSRDEVSEQRSKICEQLPSNKESEQSSRNKSFEQPTCDKVFRDNTSEKQLSKKIPEKLFRDTFPEKRQFDKQVSDEYSQKRSSNNFLRQEYFDKNIPRHKPLDKPYHDKSFEEYPASECSEKYFCGKPSERRSIVKNYSDDANFERYTSNKFPKKYPYNRYIKRQSVNKILPSNQSSEKNFRDKSSDRSLSNNYVARSSYKQNTEQYFYDRPLVYDQSEFSNSEKLHYKSLNKHYNYYSLKQKIQRKTEFADARDFYHSSNKLNSNNNSRDFSCENLPSDAKGLDRSFYDMKRHRNFVNGHNRTPYPLQYNKNKIGYSHNDYAERSGSFDKYNQKFKRDPSSNAGVKSQLHSHDENFLNNHEQRRQIEYISRTKPRKNYYKLPYNPKISNMPHLSSKNWDSREVSTYQASQESPKERKCQKSSGIQNSLESSKIHVSYESSANQIPHESPRYKTLSKFKNRASREPSRNRASREPSRNRASRESSKNRASRESSKNRASRESSKNRASRESSRNRTSREPSRNGASREPSRNGASREPSRNRASREPSKNRASRESSRNRASREPSKNRASRDSSKNRASRDSSRNQVSRESSKNRASDESPRNRASDDSPRNQASGESSTDQVSGESSRNRTSPELFKDRTFRESSKDQISREPSKNREYCESSKIQLSRKSSKSRDSGDSSENRLSCESPKNRPSCEPSTNIVSNNYSKNPASYESSKRHLSHELSEKRMYNYRNFRNVHGENKKPKEHFENDVLINRSPNKKSCQKSMNEEVQNCPQNNDYSNKQLSNHTETVPSSKQVSERCLLRSSANHPLVTDKDYLSQINKKGTSRLNKNERESNSDFQNRIPETQSHKELNMKTVYEPYLSSPYENSHSKQFSGRYNSKKYISENFKEIEHNSGKNLDEQTSCESSKKILKSHGHTSQENVSNSTTVQAHSLPENDQDIMERPLHQKNLECFQNEKSEKHPYYINYPERNFKQNFIPRIPPHSFSEHSHKAIHRKFVNDRTLNKVHKNNKFKPLSHKNFHQKICNDRAKSDSIECESHYVNKHFYKKALHTEGIKAEQYNESSQFSKVNKD